MVPLLLIAILSGFLVAATALGLNLVGGSVNGGGGGGGGGGNEELRRDDERPRFFAAWRPWM